MIDQGVSNMEIRQAKILKELQMETWLTKNKITRFRGILKLHARDKKLQYLQAKKLRSAVSKKLASIILDIEKDRNIVSFLSEGNKQRMLELLSDYREFYLALNHLQASEIYEAIYQDNNVKRRLLDKLYYKKKKKLKQAIELEMERSTLSIELEEQEEILPDYVIQRLVIRLQESITKHNAARIIHFTYCSMLNILKKDATFFDTLLDILKEDQYLLYKTILRVTIMGQLAAENLDNIREKYKHMRHVILYNMKIREQMLTTVRSQVDDLWTYVQSLVRVESDTAFTKKEINETYADKIIQDQLMQLENICDRMRDILLVNQHHELLSRFEDQSDHKTALLRRLDVSVKDRDLLLSKKDQAEHTLEVLKYSTRSIAEERKLEKCEMLEQIEVEKEREKELKKIIKDRGDLLVKVREALHSMSCMLFFIKPAKARKVVKDKEKSIEDIERENILFELQEGEANILLLLAKVTRKINSLFGMSNFEIEDEHKAQDIYETYVSNYTSTLIFGTGEEEPIELLLEPKMIDTTILTRTDIKLRSKEIIEAHLKLE
ncbi:hypothetical protein HN011_005498 [Eciton burchellii]|nr:hypothetical protein HN011_005498 [Eciton burchellii]